MLAEAARGPFAGVVFAHQLRVSSGACVAALALIATAGEPAALASQIVFLRR